MWTAPLRGKHLLWAITGADDPYSSCGISVNPDNILYLACCCQGFLLLGYDQGVMSGIVSAFHGRSGYGIYYPDARSPL